MTIFAVCSEVIRNAPSDRSVFVNVLVPFLQDNKFRIAIDLPQNRIITAYKAKATNDPDGLIAFWINQLFKIGSKCIEYIKVEEVFATEPEMFFEIAKRIVGNKSLIVWSRQDYSQIKEIDRVSVMDRVEAEEFFSTFWRNSGKPTGENQMSGGFSGDVNNAIIIMNSKVDASSLAITQNHSGQVETALRDLAAYAAKSGSTEAQERVTALTEELARKTPRKGILRDIWGGLVSELPDVTKAVASVVELVKVFAPQ